MTSISVVMPCHNRSYDLRRVLDAYNAQIVTKAFEVIAIDDASIDSTYEVLSSYSATRFKLTVDRLPDNRGPAVARNRGIEIASAPLTVFVGDDILPAWDFIEGHLQAHNRYPQKEIAILGSIKWGNDLPQNTLMQHIDGIGAQQFSYYWLKDGQVYDYRHFYTANISVKTDFLRASHKWFDQDFKYAAFEDAELAYRLMQKGLCITYVEGISCAHYHYHTVWSFSQRQFTSGLMAWVFVKKHPLVARLILRKKYVSDLIWFVQHPKKTLSHQSLESLEQQALHLASFYEWLPQQLLDRFYIGLLEYYYHKGVLAGVFSKGRIASRISGSHGARSLLPLVSWFIQTAINEHIPLPAGYENPLQYSQDIHR